MKNIFSIMFGLAGLIATPSFGQTIPRSYELQCNFIDGSQFIFKQHYTWNPIAAMIPADVTVTKDAGYEVRFIDKKGKKSDWLKYDNMSFSDGRPKDFKNAQRVCSNKSMVGDRFFYGPNYLDDKLRWKAFKSSRPNEFYLNVPSAEQPEVVRIQLTTRQLSPDAVTTVVRGQRVIFEQSLVDVSPEGKRKDGNLTITAVYQSESLDGGKTWPTPIITTDAKIFELGKSLDAQSFVGFPHSFNGKLFDAQRPVK